MQLIMNRHVTGDQLESYALGRLDEAELGEFEDHLLICEQCREALSAEEAFIRSMRVAARESRQQSAAHGWRFLPAPAWAVALTILVVLAGMWRLSSRLGAVAPAIVLLEATRGAVTAPNAAPARHALNLRLDSTGLPPLASYTVEIVDAAGHPVLQTSAAQANHEVRARVARGLPAGMYYVRLYAPGQELLREYGLHVNAR